MGLERVYESKLTREVLLEILKEGRVPTQAEVQDKIDRIVQGRRLDRPLHDLSSSLVERKERASALKWNRMAFEIKRDLEALYESSFELAKQSSAAFDRSSAEMQLMLSKVRELESRLSSLLLIKADTAGYFNFVFDTFETNSKIDETGTTAFVDLRSTTVHAAPRKKDADDLDNEHGELIFPIKRRKERAFQVGMDSRSVVKANTVPSLWLHNAWGPSDRVALYQVVTNKATPVTVAMQFDFAIQTEPSRDPDEHLVYLSKVVLDPHLTNESGPMTTTLQYRDSNITNIWRNVPTNDFLRDVRGKAAWTFTRTKMAAIRLIMTKLQPDRVRENGSHVYDFGVRHIALFDQLYQESSEDYADTELVTTALSATDRNGAKVEFNKVTLEACERLPAGTGIDYYVDFGVGGAFSGVWSPISPTGRQGGETPKIVSFDRVSTSAAEDEVLIMTGATGPGTDQNFRQHTNNFNRVLDIYTRKLAPAPAGSVTCLADAILGTPATDMFERWEIWRNVARTGDNFSILDADQRVVEAGWAFDGTYYSCYAHIEEEAGVEIDFGPNEIFINEVPRSGRIRLGKGTHSIRTHRTNWYSLDGMHTLTAFDPITKLFTGLRTRYGADGQDAVTSEVDTASTEVDPLFPFNHKLLIEGLSYRSDFPPKDKVYVGVTRVAAHLMKHVSLQDFVTNVDDRDLTRWSTSTIIDDAGGGASLTRPILKTSVSDGTAVGRERFSIVRKGKSGTLPTEIKLRAVFRTSNPDVTPVLDDYRIKLGI